MKRFLIFSALLAVLCYGAMAQNRKGTFNTMSELRTLLEVDRLPEYRGGVVEQISSYDPTGGNEDGFAGKYSYIRKEDNGHLVLADLEGPGVVNRIWTPTPTRDTLLFFFDGEKAPRLKVCFADLFSGKVEPFVRPLCANEVGGYYCYFPFVYSKSLKIVFTGKNIQFHQIQYRSLEGEKVETYTPDLTPEMQELVGGYIETVMFTDNLIIVCNEEGRLIPLPYNMMKLYGTFFVAGIEGDEFRSLTDEEVMACELLINGGEA